MKVLFIHRDLPFYGGVPRVLLTLARSRNPARLEMSVASLVAPSPQMQAAFAQLGINPFELGDRGYVQPVRKLRRLIQQQGYNAIVANSFKAYLIACIACAGLNCRAIPWIHSIPLVLDGRFRRLLFDWLARDTTVIFPSDAIRQAHWPASHSARSAVIFNGVTDPLLDSVTQPYDRSALTAMDIPPDALTICFIAEFIGWKDHATLLRAFELLEPRLNAHLLLIGTGQLFDSTKAAAATMRSSARIHFLGPRTDAQQIAGAADLYVHPSRGEGFGLAVVEAMLASRPVIVARQGAFPEYITDHSNGVLFAPGGEMDLADKITELADNRPLAGAIGQRARAYALRTFAPDQFAQSICNVIESTVC